jgi:hypothetical protein
MESTLSSPKIERDEHGRILPGQPALNPLGRPKGKSIKDRVWEWLEDHPEDMQGFIDHFVKKNRDLAWQMLEGKPPQKMDHELSGNITFQVVNYEDNTNPPQV